MKLADLSTGPDWVVYVGFIIFAVLSIVLISGHGSWLISGYNTASKEEKAKYNEKKLCRTMGIGMSVIAILLLIMGVFENILPAFFVYIALGIILADVVIIIVLGNTICRRWQIGILEVTMAFDFKKEFKEFYMPKNKPEIVNVPKANYIAVRGKGNPNEEGGAYQHTISILYAVAYTLKMSYKTDYKIEGFFEYVVPPLEGFWWQDDVVGVDYTNKSAFNWISVIRLPDFISKADFNWAVETATKKKKLDCSSAEYLTIDEGLCVQIMHIGSFDNEPATVALMDAYLEQNGYVNDINKDRLHHEIYMSDARKAAPEKWKTVIRHPIKKA